MKHRINISVILLAFFSFVLLITGTINSASAETGNTNKEGQIPSNRIYGKVTDTIDVTGYTYAEVDTGKEKVWVAGPVTPLKTGDTIGFSTMMPMENYHSTTLERDFPLIYFSGRFFIDEDSLTSEAVATAAPHAQIKNKSKTIKEIKQLDGGNTIAEIYADKLNLSGKLIRVRGQVTKYTAEVMGKNWVHIMDNSTLDDLTVTTDKKVAIDDIVVVEGKLELDKDYGYGYVYPVIIEDAKLAKE